MSFNYYTLQPHRFDLVPNNRYERGRAGFKPEFIVRHHLMMVNATGEAVRKVWEGRVASAHYTVQGAYGRLGQISQHVYDANTAWANANRTVNRKSYAIEHSNNSGRVGGSDYNQSSWNIDDEVIIGGARWASALLIHDKMGPPIYGTTIRDHNWFTATGCPVHLQGPRAGNAWSGRAGKYHHEWMEEAKFFYDQLDKKLVHPDGTPIATFTGTPKPAPQEELTVSEADRIIREIKDWMDIRLTGPVGTDLKDVRQQITGGRDSIPGDLAASYPGHELRHIMQNVIDKGYDNLTLVDMIVLLLVGNEEEKESVRKLVLEDY